MCMHVWFLYSFVNTHCIKMKFGSMFSTIFVLLLFEGFVFGAEYTVTVMQGEQALLPCILPTGLDDNVTVTWSHWEQELSVGDNVTIDDDRFTLYRPYERDWYMRLSNAQLQDVGRYSCNVEDEEFTSFVTLVVESPPKITGYASNEVFIQICYKARLTLYCNSTGLPRPTVTWYKLSAQNRPIRLLSDLELFEQRIFIPEVDETSAGVFMCKVKNAHGETSMKFKVSVIDLITINEPVQKSEPPRQIVHSPVLSNSKDSVYLVPHQMSMLQCVLTILLVNFINTVIL